MGPEDRSPRNSSTEAVKVCQVGEAARTRQGVTTRTATPTSAPATSLGLLRIGHLSGSGTAQTKVGRLSGGAV